MILAEAHADPHWFWALLLAACLIWYSTVTVYVAIRGALDIRQMLARLSGVCRACGGALDREGQFCPTCGKRI